MELNNSVQSVVLKAQQLRLKAGAPDLYAEHILVVLLRCLDESLEDAPELSFKEMKAIDKYAGEWFDDQSKAADELEKGLGKNEVSLYGSGMAMLERAGNLAPDGVVTIEHVMEALGEDFSPLMEEVMGRGNKSVDPYATVAESTTMDERSSAQTVTEASFSSEPSGAETVVEDPADLNNDDLTPSQFIAFLELLAHLQEDRSGNFANPDSNKGNNKQKNRKQGSNRSKVKKRTKMGLFTYHGGKVAAAIQYFLLSLVVPFLLMLGLDLAFGWVSEPTTVFQEIIVNLLVTLGVYSVAKGIALILGQLSNAFGNFLETLCDLLLIYCLASSVASAQGLEPWPLRIRLGVTLVGILCLILRKALYSHLDDQDDTITVKFSGRARTGTAGKIFFGNLGAALIYPAIVLGVIWTFGLSLPGWLEKILWILAFILYNNVILIMWLCLAERSDSFRHRKGRYLIKFCQALRYFLTPCALVVFLGWLFAWLPFRRWVWIVMIVYAVLIFLVSLIYVHEEKKH